MQLTWPQIHLAAAREAMRAHRDLGLDATRRIDPFAALERAGVVVMRRPVDNLAGLYLPGNSAEGSADGVLINTDHPLPKQRYTAAHELAHHRRDRLAVADTDTEWLGRGSRQALETERFAEAFAAWFLMPKRLVQSTLERLGVMPAGLEGPDAYGLALELGTSYAATVRHLSDMRLIGEAKRDRLLAIQPQAIKRSLGATDVTSDSRKDVWLVRSSQDASPVYPVEGDALVLALPEIPSSGYLWQPTEVPSWLQLVRDEYRVSDAEFVGGQGERRFLFRVGGPGRQQIRLVLGQPWDPRVVAKSFKLDVVAQPQPQQGLVQPELLAAASA